MTLKPTPEERARAGRKPLPRTLRAWHAELAGVAKIVAHKTEVLDEQGKKWWDSTRAYYVARLKVLAEKPPELIDRKQVHRLVKRLIDQLK